MNKTYTTPIIKVHEIDPQDLVCTSGGSTDISVGNGDDNFDAKRRSPIWDDYDN